MAKWTKGFCVVSQSRVFNRQVGRAIHVDRECTRQLGASTGGTTAVGECDSSQSHFSSIGICDRFVDCGCVNVVFKVFSRRHHTVIIVNQFPIVRVIDHISKHNFLGVVRSEGGQGTVHGFLGRRIFQVVSQRHVGAVQCFAPAKLPEVGWMDVVGVRRVQGVESRRVGRVQGVEIVRVLVCKPC